MTIISAFSLSGSRHDTVTSTSDAGCVLELSEVRLVFPVLEKLRNFHRTVSFAVWIYSGQTFCGGFIKLGAAWLYLPYFRKLHRPGDFCF